MAIIQFHIITGERDNELLIYWDPQIANRMFVVKEVVLPMPDVRKSKHDTRPATMRVSGLAIQERQRLLTRNKA